MSYALTCFSVDSIVLRQSHSGLALYFNCRTKSQGDVHINIHPVKAPIGSKETNTQNTLHNEVKWTLFNTIAFGINVAIPHAIKFIVMLRGGEQRTCLETKFIKKVL